jgi:biopolymer transport protein ExbD
MEFFPIALSLKTTAMASIETNQKKSKYFTRSVSVDMTPMVDLGFLLITFFIFTTSMMKDQAMKYNTPVPDLNNPILVKCTKTITIQPGDDGKVKWIDCVDGVEQAPLSLHLYAGHELRTRLLAKREQIKSIFGDPHDLFVIVKPDSTCSYQTFIDVMDELMITDVTRYSVPE